MARPRPDEQAAVPARRRLVEAALTALEGLSPAEVVGSIGVREIARRAGTTPSTLYHHFGDLEGLTRVVLDRLFAAAPEEATPADGPESVERGTPLLATEVGRLEESVRSLIEDPDFPVRLGLWALGSPEAATAYAAWLAATEETLLQAGWPISAEGRGEEPRPPLDRSGLVAAFVALRHGTALRQLVDPRPQRPDHFALAFRALVATLVRQRGDQHHADARLAEMNYYPLEGRRRSPRSALDRRDHLLDLAEELLDQGGLPALTLSAVARRAELSTDAVAAVVGAPEEMAVAVVRRRLGAPATSASSLVERALTPRDHTLLAAIDTLSGCRAFLLPYALVVAESPPVEGEEAWRHVLVHELGAIEGACAATLLLDRLLDPDLAAPVDAAALLHDVVGQP